ncbi:MAG: coproporphyrinogen III oxidase [bacterium]|nr:coproporphyrinogen III oxidase [bacterium]
MTTPLGLYIHWPFCASKCPYCDFNSHVRDKIEISDWKEAYIKELSHAAALSPNRPIETIFFGGGTPSLMPPSLVEYLLNTVHDLWPVSKNVEVTLEANPTSVEADKFKDLRSAGINRLSIGVQSFNDEALKFLGREHNAGQAKNAIALAAQHFPRFSFDLITARPTQTLSQWREELKEALSFNPGHLSIYQLTLEPGTPFYRYFQTGRLHPLDEETSAQIYEETQEILENVGLPAYEISNHAKPGHECRHNLRYWNREDVIGVGPGAHGRLTMDEKVYETEAIRTPEAWKKAVLTKGDGWKEPRPIDLDDQIAEWILMGLRTKQGLNSSVFSKKFQKDFFGCLNEETLKDLEKDCLITLCKNEIFLTKKGRLLSDFIINKILKTRISYKYM